MEIIGIVVLPTDREYLLQIKHFNLALYPLCEILHLLGLNCLHLLLFPFVLAYVKIDDCFPAMIKNIVLNFLVIAIAIVVFAKILLIPSLHL